jgi:N-acetylglucosamine-6-sulfatase
VDRKAFLKLTAGAGAAVLTAGMQPPRARAAPNTARKNVLLIITDDQPYNTVKFMSAVRTFIADQGMVFDRAYVADPLCDPDRCSMLLGVYPHNHMMYSNNPPKSGAVAFRKRGHEPNTWLARLRDRAGYATAYFGKWLHDHHGHTPYGIDRSYTFTGTPVNRDSFIISNQGENRRIERGDGSGRWDDTDLLRERFVSWVRSRRGVERPWAAVFAPYAPHGPYGDAFVPRRVERLFENVAREPGPYNDRPEHYRVTAEGTNDAKNRQEYQDKRKEIKVVDDAVREICATLGDIGQLEDTYIFFTTDNPYMLGEHKLTRKGKFYEASSRLPFVVAGPGVAHGRSDALVSMVDLHATFLEIGGVTEFQTDGMSLLPVLSQTGTPPTWRTDMLVEHFAGNHFSMLRTENQAYVEFGPTGDRLLYDMASDSDQRINVYPKADDATKASLSSRLAELRKCSGVLCR